MRLRASEIRRAAGVAGVAGTVAAAAGRAAGVAARFVGAAADSVARLVHELAPAVRPLAGRFTGAFVLLGGGIAPVARLFANRAAQIRARFRREQHAEAGAEHGPGQQAHHEPGAAAAAFVVIP